VIHKENTPERKSGTRKDDYIYIIGEMKCGEMMGRKRWDAAITIVFDT
jgi:hypothetical protein